MAKKLRNKLYVDPSVQWPLAKRIVFHWLIFIAAAVAFTACFEFLIEDPFQDFSTLLEQILARHGLLLIVLFALIPVFVYDTVKLSNRFAGPMLRFRRSMKQLGDGQTVGPLHFRDGDFWHELAEDYNRALARLEAAEKAQTPDETPEPETCEALT